MDKVEGGSWAEGGDMPVTAQGFFLTFYFILESS